MGTVRKIASKRSGVRWRAEVFVKGIRSSKNFDSQAEALTWIDDREVTLTGNGRIHEGKTVADALQEYARVESPKKKGARWEIVRLKKFERNPIQIVC